MSMIAGEWSISALSVEFGVDRRTIAKRLRHVHSVGKKGNANVYLMADAAKAVFAPTVSSGQGLDVTHETARLKKYQADKTQLEVEVLKGNLIPGETVGEVWSDFIGACRAKLVSLPSTAAPRVAGLSVSEAEAELRDLVHPALEELKDYEPSQYGTRGSKQIDQGICKADGAAAKPNGKRVGGRKKAPVKRGKRGARKVAD